MTIWVFSNMYITDLLTLDYANNLNNTYNYILTNMAIIRLTLIPSCRISKWDVVLDFFQEYSKHTLTHTSKYIFNIFTNVNLI